MNHSINRQFTCYVIGEGSLAIKCSELLLKKHHHIMGVISPNPEVQQWANNNDIEYLVLDKDSINHVTSTVFDFLFSISNLAILPDELINAPRISAINYHDGLLPRYAGVNVTSWAIMKGSKDHGVTWHEMSSGVDKGNILKQVFFDIEDDETALSLNAKCFEHGYLSFKELMDEFVEGSVESTVQNFDSRTYFGKYKRPKQGAIIDWNRSAEDISSFVRALDFGQYPNPLCLPKIKVGDKYLIAHNIKIEDVPSNALPGTISEIGENHICIATKTKDIAIEKVLSVYGRPIRIADLIEKYSLTPGCRHPALGQLDAQAINNINSEIVKYEPYWVQVLSDLEFINLHLKRKRFALKKSVDFKRERLDFTEAHLNILNATGSKPHLSMAALFLIFIGKYCGKYRFSIGCSNIDLLNYLNGYGGLFSKFVPIKVSFDPKTSIANGIDTLVQSIEKTVSHKTYPLDIWSRYPQLRSKVNHFASLYSPINIVFSENASECEVPPNSTINFVVSKVLEPCYFVYDSACIDHKEVLNLKTRFISLLQDVVLDSNKEISKFSVLLKSENNKIFEEWNDTNIDLPAIRCVHQLFEKQARKTPKATAILYSGGTLTYEKLNARSNQLAHRLHKLGVKRESLVGVYMNQSPDMIIALLAILKAGGAYVPLDCAFPRERIAYMIQDSGCQLILTGHRLKDEIDSKNSIIEVDLDWDDVSQNRTDDLNRSTSPEDLAYVMYTSGSTGKPKGVMVEHRNVANFFVGMDGCIGYGPDMAQNSTWLAVTSISFDISVLEIFWTLCRGFKVVLGAEKGISHISARTEESNSKGLKTEQGTLSIPEMINKYNVTHFQCTPSMASMLMWDKTAKSAFGSLKTLLIGGESFPVSLAAQLRGIVKGDILNMYGPTETTVWSTAFKLDNVESGISIGRPIANTKIYLLDQSLQPVPVGETAELMIAGEGVVRGYLNRSELTSERFIKDPFSDKPEGRLYRTGDLARYLPDGNIEFLGRMDHQIKLLGHRIELGEIEAALNQLSSVHETVVIAQKKRLIAFIIPAEESVINKKKLRDYAMKKLPIYMVPAEFIEVKSFPKTPNNKIDRNAFPLPGEMEVEDVVFNDSPQADLERALSEIWAAVLDVSHVSLNDNFFDLGGDTTSAKEMLEIVGKTCEVALPSNILYEVPTLSAFTLKLEEVFISQAESENTNTPQVDIERKLVQIWSDVLGIEEIDVCDNFFDLGGNSLSGMRIVFNIQLELGINLPLSSIFNAPTVSQLSRLIAVKIDSRMMPRKNDVDISKHPIVSNDDETSFPLSYVQNRFWVLQTLDPDQPVYNVAIAFRLKGQLNVKALVDSINFIVQRHDILRTTFPTYEDMPTQKPNNFIPLQIPVRDLTSSKNDITYHHMAKLLQKEARRPFGLDSKSFLRIQLFKTGADDHTLSITSHHLVLDGWSIRIFAQELGELYRAKIEKRNPGLPELPIQYGNYADWEQKFIIPRNLKEQSVYWKNKLEGASFVLELPTDYKRPPVETFGGETYPVEMSKLFTKKLREFSQSQGVTLFTTLLGAFQTLLYRYSRQDDILVGTAVANINRNEIQHLLGSFSNNIVLRAIFHDSLTFAELLQQLKNTVLEAHAHQDFPFEKLLDEIQPERDLSRNPLFQAAFIFHHSSLEKHLQFDELRFDSIPVDLGSSRFDITLEVDDDGERIVGFLEFKKDLYRKETIAQMARHLMTLLETVIMESNRPVSQIDMLSGQEINYLLTDLNRTQKKYPKHLCIHQCFEGQVLKTPEKPAVVFGSSRISFRELDERSNQIAHYLHNMGVGPNTFVGLCTDRSLEMLICMLGILKAGGAYLPLDPSYPEERLSYMLADSGAPVVVSQSNLKQRAPIHENVRLVCLDDDAEAISKQSSMALESNIHPEDAAYIIYTSGSTGRPKGVQVPHRAVVNFLLSMGEKPGFNENDILLAVTTLSFDIHVLEIYLPLLFGGQVVIADRETAMDGNRLLNILIESDVTVMQATPSTWRLLLAAGWEGSPNLKILCGGEAFPPDLLKELLPRSASVWNMYGPTETTVWSSCHHIKDDENPILIGRPIANTQFYVLDQFMQPVPIGVPGELHIGGDGVAIGYLNRSELTGIKFIPDPFKPETGARLYKTGDLARFHANGHLEYLTRMDSQVKVRGFRIELGEIESVLGSYPVVDIGVASVIEEQPGDVRLVGYIVVKPEKKVDVAELKDYLHTKLPDYMVPSHFVELEELPLTPAGKVDRKHLPPPKIDNTMIDSEYIAPGNEIEVTLADILQNLINVPRIGIQDNFFNIGGNSLLAIQFINRINQTFQTQLTLRQLYDTPKIVEMASTVGRALIDGIESLSDEEIEKLLKE